MIIICPACSTRYSVDASAIPFAGRRVECNQCGWIWRAGGAGGSAGSPATQRPTPAYAPAAEPSGVRFALPADARPSPGGGEPPAPRLSFEIGAGDADGDREPPAVAPPAAAAPGGSGPATPPPLPAQDEERHVRLDERRGGASALAWFTATVILALVLAGGFIYQAEILDWMTGLGLTLPLNS